MPGSVIDNLDFVHQPQTEPIPGYRLLEPLGRGGFGEVWKCEAPGGLLKAIKFVCGGMHVLDQHAPAEDELRAIQHVKSIRHPFMLSMERIEVVAGELVIVMELADQSLADVLAHEQAQGNPGIPRDSLLKYLREAAEVLDVMNTQHHLQHLDVKPRNLFLVSNHVKVADFGMVNTLSGNRSGQADLAAITPLYASPEVFQGSISPHSDQYSLAIVYQELLTGKLPFTGKNIWQLLMLHLQGQPDLQSLPESDRLIIARALSKNPRDRYSSCTELIQALIKGSAEVITLPIQPLRPPSSSDTQRTHTVRTIQIPTVDRPTSRLGSEATRELKLGELIRRTPTSEVWQATNDAGQAFRVQVLYGCPDPGDVGIALLKILSHPLLVPVDVLDHVRGKLTVASPMPQSCLREVLLEYQRKGWPGIPRQQLLAYLRPVAEGLDELFRLLQLQHLGLSPQVMALHHQRVQLLDFGLVALVARPARLPLVRDSGRYAAPELHANQVSSTCDQYSLALIYLELLTGIKASADAKALESLPMADRSIVARALQADPRKRWKSCIELINALEAVTPAEQLFEPQIPSVPHATAEALQPLPESVQTRLGTNLAADAIAARLETFRLQHKAEQLRSEPHLLVYCLQASQHKEWPVEARPQLLLRVQICPPDISVPEGVQVRTEVRLDLSAREPSAVSEEQLQDYAAELFASVRSHLRGDSQTRKQERIPWHYPLLLQAILPDGTSGPSIECQGKDISANGIGFYLPGNLPESALVRLELPSTPQTPQLSVPARIVRAQGCGEGWFEVGALLLPPGELPGQEEESFTGSGVR
jgi:serine/threonine protein kinase